MIRYKILIRDKNGKINPAIHFVIEGKENAITVAEHYLESIVLETSFITTNSCLYAVIQQEDNQSNYFLVIYKPTFVFQLIEDKIDITNYLNNWNTTL